MNELIDSAEEETAQLKRDVETLREMSRTDSWLREKAEAQLAVMKEGVIRSLLHNRFSNGDINDCTCASCQNLRELLSNLPAAAEELLKDRERLKQCRGKYARLLMENACEAAEFYNALIADNVDPAELSDLKELLDRLRSAIDTVRKQP